jgi:hypothetical protein
MGLKFCDGFTDETGLVVAFRRLPLKCGRFLEVWARLAKMFRTMDSIQRENARFLVEGTHYGLPSRDHAMRVIVDKDDFNVLDAVLAGAETKDVAGLAKEVARVGGI